ncbi:MAG: 50S ribosomal protein L18 [Nanoarchaeota archaeon]
MKGIGKTIPRRRKQSKTDYKSRVGLIKSDSARLVVRRSNRFVLAQIVLSDGAQDRIICQASSKELLAHGWPKEFEGSLKGLPAAYLTGMLIASKAKKNNVKKAILDIGMQRSALGGRIYAVLKGAVDFGLEIPHGKNAVPDEKRLSSVKETHALINSIRGKIK